MIYEIIKGLGNLSDIFEAGENIFKVINSQIKKRKIKNLIFLKFIDLCENNNLNDNEMKEVLQLFSCNEKIENKNVFLQINAYNSNEFLKNAANKLSKQLFLKFQKIWNELQEYDLEINYNLQPDYVQYLARFINACKKDLIAFFSKNSTGTYVSNSIFLKDLELEECPHCKNKSSLEYVLEEKPDGLKIIRAFCKFCGKSFVKLDYEFLVQGSNNSSIDEQMLINIFEKEIKDYNTEIINVINDKTKDITSKMEDLDGKIAGLKKDINKILNQMSGIVRKEFEDKNKSNITNSYHLIKYEFEQTLPNKTVIETQCNNILAIDSNDIKANFFLKLIYKKTNPQAYEVYLKSLQNMTLKFEDFNDIIPFIIQYCDYRTKDIIIELLKAKDRFEKQQKDEIEKSLRQRDYELDWFADIERDIFICYSSQDREKTTAIVEKLEEEGYECWIDYRNMEHPQDNYYEKIYDNLKLCKVFVFISSISSIRSNDCKNEIRHASVQHKPMIEYLISSEENFRPKYLNKYFTDEWTDAREQDKMNELIDRIESKLLEIENIKLLELTTNKKTIQTDTTKKEKKSDKSENKVTEDKSILSKKIKSNENDNLEIDYLQFVLNKDKKSYSLAKSLKNDVTNIIIPSTHCGLPVTSIEENAFCDCSNITNIVIPNNITRIGVNAFSNCYRLVEVYNLSNLNIATRSNKNGYVGYYAKVIHTSLEEKTNIIEKNNFVFIKSKSNKYYLVTYKGKETKLVLPNDIEGHNYVINQYAFDKCSSLTSIVIPNSVTSIGHQAFSSCSSLTSIVIPNSVTSIGNGAFSTCNSLTSITIPFVGESLYGANYTHFGYIFGAFSYDDTSKHVPSSLKEVFITGGKSIGIYAFFGCNNLTRITIPNSVTSIGGGAFSGCSSLPNIVIPNNVTSIGYFTFENCYSLTNIEIPNSVTSISDYAFSGCSNLTSITIPNSVTSIGEDTFSGCEKLAKLFYTSSNYEIQQLIEKVLNKPLKSNSIMNQLSRSMTKNVLALELSCQSRQNSKAKK